MRKVIFIIAYSLYFIFVLGLFLHTSAHPQVFHKYTIKYIIMLTGLVLFFPLFLWITWFSLKDTTFKFRKKKYHVKPIHKIVFILILFILVILLPAELFLRHKYKGYESTTYLYTVNNFQPFLQMQPSTNTTLPIDNYGFRGENITVTKPANTYRIFVLGGSTVYNSAIPYEQTFAKILEKDLQKKYRDKKIQVLNAGMDGYTTEHSLIQYLFKIKDFHPDLIIMWHGINDWYYSCSPSALADEPYQSDYSHFLGADANMVFEHFTLPPIFQIKLLSYDFFIKAMQDNWYSDIIAGEQRLHPNPGIYTDETKSMTYDMKNFSSMPSYKRNISSLINATKDDHVKLILGDQPSLYSDDLSAQAKSKLFFPKLQCTNSQGKYPSLDSMINAMKVYNNAMKNEAENNNIPFVDLAAQIPKNLSYFTDDVHYTPIANAKIAQVLYNTIVSLNYIQ